MRQSRTSYQVQGKRRRKGTLSKSREKQNIFSRNKKKRREKGKTSIPTPDEILRAQRGDSIWSGGGGGGGFVHSSGKAEKSCAERFVCRCVCLCVYIGLRSQSCPSLSCQINKAEDEDTAACFSSHKP